MSNSGPSGVFRTFYVMYACLSAFSFFTNFSVLLFFACMVHHGNYKVSNFMFCMQAISDLIVNLLTTLFVIACSDMRSAAHSKSFSFAIRFLLDYSQFLAIGVLLLITVERFLSIKFPLQHRTRVTTNRILGTSAFVFLLPCIPPAVFIALNSHYAPLKVTPYFITTGTVCFAMLLLVYCLLLESYRVVRNMIYSQIGEDVRQNGIARQKKQQKMNKRVVAILSSMAVIYTLTFLPMIVLRFGYSVMGFTDLYKTLVTVMTTLFVYLSSTLWNPLITLFFKEDYRREMFDLANSIWANSEHFTGGNRRKSREGSKKLQETEL